MLLVGSAIGALYFVVFVVLWLGGGYVYITSGRTWFGPDTIEWQPLFGNCQPEYQWPGPPENWLGGKVSPKCDVVGWAYFPLWLMVRKNHPVYTLGEYNDLPFVVIDPSHLPDGFKIHPTRGRELDSLLKFWATNPNFTLD
jgi:hypothetical protein